MSVPHRYLAVGQQSINLSLTTTTSPQTITPIFEATAEMTVDWGDGVIETIAANTATELSHSYTTAGAYVVKLSGDGIDNFVTINVFGDPFDFDIVNLPTGADNYICVGTNITGDVANLPTGANVYNFGGTNITGDVANLPTGAQTYGFSNTNIFGDVANIPAGGVSYFLNNTNVTATGLPSLPSAVTISLPDNGFNQATVDKLLFDIYIFSQLRTITGGFINLGGSNAAPSGVLQPASACPVTVSTDGKEVAHELVNDGCATGFNTWSTVTITA